jgi:hypothetical protein
MAGKPRRHGVGYEASSAILSYEPACPGQPIRAATFDDFDERFPQRVHSISFVSSSSTVWSW